VSGCRLGLEEAAKARPGELNANQKLAAGQAISHMHDPSLGSELGLFAACAVVRKRNQDLQIGADGDVEARTNAAPPLHRFSLEVSSSKGIPRLSRPSTVRGRRTAILRSERCFETEGVT
jgi:hypothetical protein